MTQDIDVKVQGHEGSETFIPFQKVAPGTAIAKEGQTLPKAFTPVTIRGVTFQNRIWVAPMCQYSYEDGFMSDWTLVAIGSYAARGASLSMIEATAVSPEGRISPYDAGLWKDEHIPIVKRIADFVHAHNQKLGIQIAHAGRLASTASPYIIRGPHPIEQGGHQPVGPSEGAFTENHLAPKELTVAEIQELVQKFKETAIRAVKAGVDVIQIHGAHGYLVNEFLSPVTNKRTDQYGGSFENRLRFLKEIVVAVKSAIPEHVLLFLRISGSDRLEWKPETEERGLTPQDHIRILKELQPLGIDSVDVSSGGVSAEGRIEYGPLFQAPLAYEIKKGVPDLHITSVGAIHSKDEIDEAFANGIDGVTVGRPFSHNTSYVLDLAQSYGVQVQWPLQIGYTTANISKAK